MTKYGVAPPAYRLPDATTVGPVRLQVADCERSIDFYERILGLQRLSGSAGEVSLGAEDGRPLIELVERPGAKPVPRRGRFGLFHFAILLPDRSALGRFATAMSEREVPLAMADHLVSEALYLYDPDGLGIEIYTDRSRESWKTRGQELAMASEPLDIQDVMADATGVPWTGMPAGTVMGHVHLHVGSLGYAEAFYHRALGFDKVVWSYPGALFLSAGGYHHHLGVNTWSQGPSASDDEARLIEWRLQVPTAADVLQVAESLQSQGFEGVASELDCRVADPWGTVVLIAAR